MEIIDRIVKYNGREAVLDDVMSSVEDMEFVTVYGKSGCGKTTLLNIIGGLGRPSSVDVATDGESLVGLTEDELAKSRLEKIGFVFQDYNRLMDLTVKNNVDLQTRFSRRKDGPGMDELLKMFDKGASPNRRQPGLEEESIRGQLSQGRRPEGRGLHWRKNPRVALTKTRL